MPPPSRRGPAPWLATLAVWLCALLPVLLSVALVVLLVRGLWAAETPAGLEALIRPRALVTGVIGSVGVLLLSVAVAVPLGVGVALHLEGTRGIVRRLLSLNVASLAAVPSVIIGLLGFELFVRVLHLGHGFVVAGLTLSLLMLPIVTMAARAALLGVPSELHEAGCALGATRWQVTRHVVIPAALPGILSGAILAITRAFGEAAALLLVAGLALPSRPAEPEDSGTPRLFVLLTDAGAEGRGEALVGVLALVCTLLGLCAWALVVRRRHAHGRGR